MSDAAARLARMTDDLHTDRLLLTPLTLDHLDDFGGARAVIGFPT